MIIPQKEKTKKSVYISICVTFAVLGILYLILIFTEMYEVKSYRELYRELDLVKIIEFLPERKREMRQEKPVAEKIAKEEVKPEVIRTQQRVDLREIIPDGFDMDFDAPTKTISERTNPDPDQGSRKTLSLEQTTLGDVGGFQTINDRSFIQPGAMDQYGVGGHEGIRLQGGTGRGTGGASVDFEGGTALGGVRGRQEESGTAPQIGLRGLEDFGDRYSDLERIYRALAEWMKNNPAELPVPVRRLMAEDRWDPSFLSSRVRFEIAGRSFDMLLMCKEEIYEIHILLVEQSNATYLIDRNFQKESNSLRTGGVDVRQNTITAVQSNMQPAGLDRTQEFYQIFLSWWNTVSSEQ